MAKRRKSSKIFNIMWLLINLQFQIMNKKGLTWIMKRAYNSTKISQRIYGLWCRKESTGPTTQDKLKIWNACSPIKTKSISDQNIKTKSIENPFYKDYICLLSSTSFRWFPLSYYLFQHNPSFKLYFLSSIFFLRRDPQCFILVIVI